MTPVAPGAATIDVDALFCDVDDVCRAFLPAWQRQLLTCGERQRQRVSRLSDRRFVALIPTALMPLCVDLNTRQGEDTGIAFMDATSLVCHHRRIHRYTVFQQVARREKTSMGWFDGFKRHRGERLAFRLTPGHVDD